MNREQRFGQHDWRMPNRRELRSLLNLQAKLPALPEQHPFIDVFNGCTGHRPRGHQPGARLVCRDRWRTHVLRWQRSSFMLWPVRGEDLCVVPRTGQALCFDAAGNVIACAGSGQDGECVTVPMA